MISSHSYTSFREQHLPAPLNLREPADFLDPIPISERLVQAIWASQLFDPESLRTRDGHALGVLHPGRWNGEGGPDFLDAILALDGVELRCDVEIHVQSAGWNDHRHADDPAYNGVRLDVCLWEFGPPDDLRTSDGQTVHQLVLHPVLTCSIEELAESLDPDRYPFSSNRMLGKPSPLLRLSREELAAQVRSAGRFRFEQKCDALARQIAGSGEDETAYQLLARALGYKHNKLAFGEIAREFPHARLRELPTPDEKIERLLHIGQEHRLRCSQVRPANHPHRRLAALALLTDRHPSPADWFRELAGDPKRLRSVPALEHPFWSRHYHLHGRPAARPVAILGSSRWREIICNVVLPFAAATARENPEAIERLLELYAVLPAAAPNRASRQIAHELGLPPPRRAIEQQGLIQMFQDFELLLPIEKA